MTTPDIFAAPPSHFTTGLADLLARRIEIAIEAHRKEDTNGTGD